MNIPDFFALFAALLSVYILARIVIRNPKRSARVASVCLFVALLLFVPFDVEPPTSYTTKRIAWQFWPTKMANESMAPISYNHLVFPWAIAIGLNWILGRRPPTPRTVPPPPA
jgi:hypothetical protein